MFLVGCFSRNLVDNDVFLAVGGCGILCGFTAILFGVTARTATVFPVPVPITAIETHDVVQQRESREMDRDQQARVLQLVV